MRNLMLAALAAVVLCGSVAAMASGGGSASANCVIPKVNVNSDTSVVTSEGSCSYHGEKLKNAWDYTYQTYDGGGYACGSAVSDGGNTFRMLPPGAAKAKVKIALHPANGMRGGATKIVITRLDGDTAMCGKLSSAQLPSKDALCGWQDAPDMWKCGIPNQWAAWSTPLSMTGNIVNLGHLVTRSGSCFKTKGKIGDFAAPRDSVWMGNQLDAWNLKCSDGVFAWVNVVTIGLVTPSGKTCTASPFGRVWSFPVPPNWGGQLQVAVSVGIGYNYLNNDEHAVALERETAVFDLHGLDDGCSALQAR